MTKDDVEFKMSQYFKNEFQNFTFYDYVKLPIKIYNVRATIQDPDYVGASTYNVLFDFRGDVIDEFCNIKGNIHYTVKCMVEVSSNKDNSPSCGINERLILKKHIF